MQIQKKSFQKVMEENMTKESENLWEMKNNNFMKLKRLKILIKKWLKKRDLKKVNYEASVIETYEKPGKSENWAKKVGKVLFICLHLAYRVPELGFFAEIVPHLFRIL